MRCQELFARLSEFLDGELTEEICQEIQAHMEGCEPCQALSRTLQRTVELCRQLPSRPLPEETRRALWALLHEGWASGEGFSG